MKVFISYSRKDEALAHLLAYILKEKGQGIECLIDRYLPKARSFTKELKTMIDDCDIVLVLLTRASLSSIWVNQEIGYATARGKTILPVTMEQNLQPDGMIAQTQVFSLFDWSNPRQAIQNLLEDLSRTSLSHSNQWFLQMKSMENIFNDKERRTEFLVGKLRELNARSNKSWTIYHQAGFSIFGASYVPNYRDDEGYTQSYMELLLAECDELNRLAKSPNTTVKMLLYPKRSQATEPEYMKARYDKLLKWLDEIKDDDSIQIAYGPFLGPSNRLLVVGEFSLEGYKVNQTTGYQMSIVRFEKQKIAIAQQDFEENWNTFFQGKHRAIQQIRDEAEGWSKAGKSR